MKPGFTMIPDDILASARVGGRHTTTLVLVLCYVVRKAYAGEALTVAGIARALRLTPKATKKALLELLASTERITVRYGTKFRELYGNELPSLTERITVALGTKDRARETRNKLNRGSDGRFAKPSSLTDQPPLGNSLKSTKGLEEPGPRADRIDQAGDTKRPEEDELHPPPPDWGEDEPITEPWMTADPYGQAKPAAPGLTIANRPVPNPQPSADRSFKANSERNPEVESKEEIKPPPDKARLNGWHLAKKVYYRVQFPGGGKPNLQPADITDPDELKDWASLGCKVEKLEIEEIVDKAGRTVRLEAVEEEKDKQKKFRQSVSQKGGQSNDKKKRSRTNQKRNEDVGPLPGTEAGTSTTEP